MSGAAINRATGLSEWEAAVEERISNGTKAGLSRYLVRALGQQWPSPHEALSVRRRLEQ